MERADGTYNAKAGKASIYVPVLKVIGRFFAKLVRFLHDDEIYPFVVADPLQ